MCVSDGGRGFVLLNIYPGTQAEGNTADWLPRSPRTAASQLPGRESVAQRRTFREVMVKPGSGTGPFHSHSIGEHYVRRSHLTIKKAGKREDGQTKEKQENESG